MIYTGGFPCFLLVVVSVVYCQCPVKSKRDLLFQKRKKKKKKKSVSLFVYVCVYLSEMYMNGVYQ